MGKAERELREFLSVDLEQTLAINLSTLHKDTGEWNKAIECLEQSVNILEKAGAKSGMISVLNTRGFLYKDREDWKNAEDDFKRGLDVARNMGDKRSIAVGLKTLGLLYKDYGKLG